MNVHVQVALDVLNQHLEFARAELDDALSDLRLANHVDLEVVAQARVESAKVDVESLENAVEFFSVVFS